MPSKRTFVTMTLDRKNLDEVVGIFKTFIKDVQEKDYGVLTYHYFVDEEGDRATIHVFEEYESSQAHLDHFTNIDMQAVGRLMELVQLSDPHYYGEPERGGAGAPQGLRERPLPPAPDQHRGAGRPELSRSGPARGRRARRGGRRRLQAEHQRGRKPAGVRAVEHAAGVGAGGEQPGDRRPVAVEHARVLVDPQPGRT